MMKTNKEIVNKRYVLFYDKDCSHCPPIKKALKSRNDVVIVDIYTTKGEKIADAFNCKYVPMLFDTETRKEIKNIAKWNKKKEAEITA